jgi:site-specific recombinase XerC
MVRRGSGATTVARAQGVLSGILADTMKSKRLEANPVNGLDNLRRSQASAVPTLSADNVTKLADNSGQHPGGFVVLA